jgi:carbonic anhydrase
VNQSPNLKAIVDRIRPGVGQIVIQHEAQGALAVEHAAMAANVRASVDQLRHGSAIIEKLISSDGLAVTGAWYSLETGRVEFFEETLPA